MVTSAQLMQALRQRVEFQVGERPDESRFVFDTPEGPLEVSAHEAVGPLSTGIRALNAHDSVRVWATPAIHALRLMATGALADPSAPDRSRIIEAGRHLDPDPARGQRLAIGFLDALLADAPAVATTPQRATLQQPPARPKSLPPLQHHVTIRFEVDPHAPVVPGAIGTATLETTPKLPRGPEVDRRIRRMLERLEVTWEPAARWLADLDQPSINVTAEELAALDAPRLRVTLLANRVTVEWPDNTRADIETVAVVDGGATGPTRFTRDRGFTVAWRFSVDGHDLTATELEQLAADSSGLVRLRDRWMLINHDRARRALSQPSRDLSAFEALTASLLGELTIDGERVTVDTQGWLDEVRQRLADRGRNRVPFTPPTNLGGTLRDYQVHGVEWMLGLHELGLGGILADDMGLGKTFMLIALHTHLGLDRPTLVVCPASVMATWEREIEKFSPTQTTHRYHGVGRSLIGVDSNFVITTYATMRSSVDDLAELDWGLVVADEAQHVKNPRSAAAGALRRLNGTMRMALTGTPIENNLTELWSILDWTTPGLLGSREQFRSRWSTPIERHRDDDTAKDLSTLIRPFVLRRRKIDPGIAPELPEKIETDHVVSLTKEQIGLYEAVSRATMAEISTATGMRRRGLVIRLITALKQICNHPAQFLKEESIDAKKLVSRSAKISLLDELLEEIIAEDGAALLFTQYTHMARLLAQHLTARGIDHYYLHGGTPVTRRETMVADFQAGRAPVFLLSLKAAGTGLNLTRADHVIHFDRWWNPAVEDQATDRAHRIGQTKAVQVHRFMTQGTIEESVAELIDTKRSLADAVMGAGEAAFTELTDAELARLVALRP